MLSSMLVVLDESPGGGAAVDLGIHGPDHYRAALVGLGVIDEPAIARPEPLPIGGSYFKARRNAVLLEHARRTVQQVLGQFERRCTEAEVPCTLLERTGSLREQIGLEAQRCDLVLISRPTQVPIGARGAMVGSLLKMLRGSPRPVVVVPTAGNRDWPCSLPGSPRAVHRPREPCMRSRPLGSTPMTPCALYPCMPKARLPLGLTGPLTSFGTTVSPFATRLSRWGLRNSLPRRSSTYGPV